jgi:ComF family protein
VHIVKPSVEASLVRPEAITRTVSRLAIGFAHLSIRIVGDLLAPPACAACEVALSGHSIFCISCASTSGPARVRAVAGLNVLAASTYGGAVATAIKRFKYGGRPDLAEQLGHLLRRALRAHPLAVDAIVPVPLHPRRLAERGFNQAALLATTVGSELEVPTFLRALQRKRFSQAQASLGKRERSENLRDAFAPRGRFKLQNKRIALVDDVLTTGATLEACASTLIAAGALSVVGVVLAETPAPES